MTAKQLEKALADLRASIEHREQELGRTAHMLRMIARDLEKLELAVAEMEPPKQAEPQWIDLRNDDDIEE